METTFDYTKIYVLLDMRSEFLTITYSDNLVCRKILSLNFLINHSYYAIIDDVPIINNL